MILVFPVILGSVMDIWHLMAIIMTAIC